ncbi:MAG: 4Fe-4S ferredoxin, partial [Nitrospirae bacterium]|nr:4Fe-4S ferredoxin [Nitrospirota bacterium]
ALYASRAQGAHFAEKPLRLFQRIKEIEEGRYDAEWDRVLKMSEQQLKEVCAELK